MAELHLKRAYEPWSPEDGFRVLVDRLWPRGLTKPEAHIDLWLKDVAPTTSLRRWFHEQPEERWREFRTRYLHELKENAAVAELQAAMRSGPVTLVYGAKDPVHNQAAVLREFVTSEGG